MHLHISLFCCYFVLNMEVLWFCSCDPTVSSVCCLRCVWGAFYSRADFAGMVFVTDNVTKLPFCVLFLRLLNSDNIYILLENYQALLWGIFQMGKFLQEKATLSFTVKYQAMQDRNL